MILTPVPVERLDAVLQVFCRANAGHGLAAPALARIAQSRARLPLGHDLPADRAAARNLLRRIGIAMLDEEPAAAFSWDGRVVRTRSEASVIVHEAAHWLLASEERRALPDFGLGAGPETGRREAADAARCLDEEAVQREEALASLLGILWEVELGQPAILAFLEQNWLEAPERVSTAEYFQRHLEALRMRGLIGEDARPVIPSVPRGR